MTNVVITQAERITSLEVQVNQLKSSVNSMESKLDDLLALRNKGVGAFWLASALIGTGIIGLVAEIMSWIKH